MAVLTLIDLQPTNAEQAALLAKLGTVDPALSAERNVDRARGTCRELLQDRVRTDIVKLRFSGGMSGDRTDVDVPKIVAIVKAEPWCK